MFFNMMSIFLFMSSCFMFSFYYKHLLLNLISMEFMMINLLINIFYTLNLLNMNIYFLSFFITISICEGVMGLSIMVYMIRISGNDYSKLLNIMKW